jgi:hypothetical protein
VSPAGISVAAGVALGLGVAVEVAVGTTVAVGGMGVASSVGSVGATPHPVNIRTPRVKPIASCNDLSVTINLAFL